MKCGQLCWKGEAIYYFFNFFILLIDWKGASQRTQKTRISQRLAHEEFILSFKPVFMIIHYHVDFVLCLTIYCLIKTYLNSIYISRW